MLVTKDTKLRISTKVDILQRLFSQGDIESLIDRLDVDEVVELQRFMWEKTVEFGIKAKGKDFSRTDVTKRMIPTPEYQRMKGCTEPSFVCKGTQCIHSNPVCAIEKIKGHIRVMCDTIREYVGLKVENSQLITV
jgi:hypothetical protein